MDGKATTGEAPPAASCSLPKGLSLRAQSLTATCTTCIQDLATGFRYHTRTEAVAALANQVRGLVGAFHRSVSVLVIMPAPTHIGLAIYSKPCL